MAATPIPKPNPKPASKSTNTELTFSTLRTNVCGTMSISSPHSPATNTVCLPCTTAVPTNSPWGSASLTNSSAATIRPMRPASSSANKPLKSTATMPPTWRKKPSPSLAGPFTRPSFGTTPPNNGKLTPANYPPAISPACPCATTSITATSTTPTRVSPSTATPPGWKTWPTIPTLKYDSTPTGLTFAKHYAPLAPKRP